MVDAFPGVELHKSTAIGRRKVFKVEFSEFTLTVTTPEHSGMRGKTTFMFRRKIHFKPLDARARASDVQVFRLQETFETEQGHELKKRIRWAKSYVLGIIQALQDAFHEGRRSPRANLFD